MVMKTLNRISVFLNWIIFNDQSKSLCASIYLKSLPPERRFMKTRKVLDTVFFWDPNHCMNSWIRNL